MTPIKRAHQACVARLTNLFRPVDEVYIWPQNNSLRLLGHSEPAPDLTLLRSRPDLYADGLPVVPDDVLLVVEVADSSLKYDRRVKALLYAEAGIPEYWIVNLRDHWIEVHTDPGEGAYRQVRRARRGERLALPVGLPGSIEVSAVVGPA